MNFLIITHVTHKFPNKGIAAYGPYVHEMNLWLKYVESVQIVAPKISDGIGAIDLMYKHDHIDFKAIPEIAFTSIIKGVISLFKIPLICLSIWRACKKADHIHLRCPGNIGLLGCFVQIFFPRKTKTAKYAGNWDPAAKQPLSYRFQKWLLSNTFFTKNMQVLVYGHWNNQSRNIKSFFTATYAKNEIERSKVITFDQDLKFVFLGSLGDGKRPLLAIKIIEELYKEGQKVSLDVYGDGILKNELASYIKRNGLDGIIRLMGNQEKSAIKEALKEAHFSILPSKSEGWPKALAEAMFFGAIPIATRVSCIPDMLDYGKRGILIKPELKNSVNTINRYLQNPKQLMQMSTAAEKWSQEYTLDKFEEEIVKLLKN
ncbi:glycosyltransferase family 4 protein [Algibacter mikhailovii]|uniref:glycosyltransferase family 4 protein n=1 Tax=Algibacter mikhailovii TaxID=425498 RepID=UPI00249524E2|nr:glycosyltransferase [Algibacter mikhailovii]